MAENSSVLKAIVNTHVSCLARGARLTLAAAPQRPCGWQCENGKYCGCTFPVNVPRSSTSMARSPSTAAPTVPR